MIGTVRHPVFRSRPLAWAVLLAWSFLWGTSFLHVGHDHVDHGSIAHAQGHHGLDHAVQSPEVDPHACGVLDWLGALPWSRDARPAVLALNPRRARTHAPPFSALVNTPSGYHSRGPPTA